MELEMRSFACPPAADAQPCTVCFSNAFQSVREEGTLFRWLDLNRMRPHLEPELPVFDLSRSVDMDERHVAYCKRCGLAYQYTVTCNVSLGPPPPQPSESFDRLTLQEARECLPEADRAGFEVVLPGWVAHMRALLNHEQHALRYQASFFLIGYENAEQNWAEVRRIVTHDDPKIVRMGLSRSPFHPGLGAAIFDVWRDQLTSANATVREHAAWFLVKWYAHNHDTEGMRFLKAHKDHAVRRGIARSLRYRYKWG